MTTITLKINERTKEGKAFLNFAKDFLHESKSVTVVEKSPYNPEFVKKVLHSYRHDKRTVIKADKLWESI